MPTQLSSMDTRKDPRLFCASVKKKRNYSLEPLDLPLPKFKHDQYWIGPIPAKECTFVNLNDNIDKNFLEEMCAKFGEIIDCQIFYHPKTKKHLGLAKILFLTQRSARDCCQSLNQTTKMGNKMSVFIDTLGAERNKMIDQLTNSLAKPSILPPPPLPPQPPTVPGSIEASITKSPVMPKSGASFMPINTASSSSSPSSTGASAAVNNNTSGDTLQLPDSSNSLESRIAALFNINVNMPPIPGMSGLGSNSSASSSTLASSSSSTSMPSSSFISGSSNLMPNPHFDHFINNSNFINKSPNIFQVIFKKHTGRPHRHSTVSVQNELGKPFIKKVTFLMVPEHACGIFQ